MVELLVRYCDLRRTSDVIKDLFRRQNLFFSVLSAWKSLNWSSILSQTKLVNDINVHKLVFGTLTRAC